MADEALEALKQQARAEQPKRRGRPPKSALNGAEETTGTAAPEPKRQAREDRFQIEKRERRKRDDTSLTGLRRHLHFPKELRGELNRRDLDCRWVKNNPLRMSQIDDADWVPVKDKNGQNIERSASRSVGDADRLVLVAKPKEWRKEDQRAMTRLVKEQMEVKVTKPEHSGDMVAGYDRGTRIGENDADKPY